MNTLDTLVQRNHDFATHRFVAGLTMRPSLQTIIISCADPRVDPVHVLGLEPGEAVVLRNVGGRVTPGTLQLLQLLALLQQSPTGASPAGAGSPAGDNAGSPSAPFNLVVLQHTHCGITRMAGNTTLMTDYFGIPPAALPAKAILDPRAAVVVDVTTLRSIPDVPGAIVVSGLVYDTETGLVDVVVPPAPLRAPTP